MIKPIVGIKEGLQMTGLLLGMLTLAHPAAEVLSHIFHWSWELAPGAERGLPKS